MFQTKAIRISFICLLGILLLGGISRFRAVYDSGLWSEEADIPRYFQMGQSLRFDGIMRPPEATPGARVTAERTMLYPAFIAVFSPCGPSPLSGIRLGQLLVHLLCIGLICYLGWIVHSGACGLLAGLAFTLSPHLSTAELSFQQVYSFFVLLSAVFFMAWIEKPRIRTAVLAGIALGLSLAFRSSMILALPAAFFWIWRRGGIKQAAAFLFCALILQAPWSARNWYHFREWIPFENQLFGYNLYGAAMGSLHSDVVFPVTAEDNLYRMTLIQLLAAPGVYLASIWHRSVLLARDLISFCTLPAVLLALAAAVLGFKDLKRRSLVLAAAYFFIVQALVKADMRYIIPIAPFIWILAASTLASIKARFQASFSLSFLRHLPAAALGLAGVLYASQLFWIVSEAARLPPGRRPSPEDSRQYLNGHAYLSQKEYEKAVSVFEEAIHVYPGWPKPYNDRGVAYALLGQAARAENDFAQALRLDSQEIEARVNLAAIRISQGEIEESLKYCEEALEILKRQKPSERRLLLKAAILANRRSALIQSGRLRGAEEDSAELAEVRLVVGNLEKHFKRALPAYPQY